MSTDTILHARNFAALGYFVYGVTKSGLTCAIAAATASYPSMEGSTFVPHWLRSRLLVWVMLPIVLFAAPAIRSLMHVLTRED
jgi:hypothetical protein